MNVLIVESENDQYFIEALAKKISIENHVYHIDNYEHSSLDEVKLTTKIKGFLLDTKRDISKIGIILDMDDSNVSSRINLVNRCLENALKEYDNVPNSLLTDTKQFVTIPIDGLDRKVACYFMNVNGEGELETVLKAIKKQKSVFADCLYEGWQECLIKKGMKIVGRGENGGNIAEKDILKLWVDFYKRFDTLKKSDRKQSEKMTDWRGLMLGVTKKNEVLEDARGEDIFDLSSPILDELNSFLKMFDKL